MYTDSSRARTTHRRCLGSQRPSEPTVCSSGLAQRLGEGTKTHHAFFSYLETGGEGALVKPWVWILWLAAGVRTLSHFFISQPILD
jgi:hypothetical protein